MHGQIWKFSILLDWVVCYVHVSVPQSYGWHHHCEQNQPVNREEPKIRFYNVLATIKALEDLWISTILTEIALDTLSEKIDFGQASIKNDQKLFDV